MSVDAKKFKGLIEEIEASEKRSKSEAEHRAAIFKRAKGDGLNPKLMRVIVRERRRNEAERQKEQDELDTYRAALNAAVALVHNEGLSQREAARRSGVSKSSLNRALAVPAVSHDPETGEIKLEPCTHCNAVEGTLHAGNCPTQRSLETADRKPPGDSSERDGEASSSGAAVASNAEAKNGEGACDSGAEHARANGAAAGERHAGCVHSGAGEQASAADASTGAEDAANPEAAAACAQPQGTPRVEQRAEVAPGPQDPQTLAAEAERLGLSGVVRDLQEKHGPQDIDLAESHPAFLKGSAPGNRKVAA